MSYPCEHCGAPVLRGIVTDLDKRQVDTNVVVDAERPGRADLLVAGFSCGRGSRWRTEGVRGPMHRVAQGTGTYQEHECPMLAIPT